jgi:hypothetical protein
MPPSNSPTLDFVMTDFMTRNIQYSDFELVCVSCRIADRISSLGFRYDIDYWFTYSNINPNGERVLKFSFATEEIAMIVKLKGIHQNG